MGVPVGSGIQPRVHNSSAAENSFPTRPSFPTVPTIPPSRVPAFPRGTPTRDPSGSSK